MSRETEKLYEGITGIRDDLIEQAEQPSSKKKVIKWKRWTALAACVSLVFGVGVPALLRGGFGGAAGGGSNGHSDGSVFMSYAGPVFPLAILETGEGLTAQRNVTYDFSLLGSQEDWEILHDKQLTDHNVSDSYVLTNGTREEQTITLCYPSAGSLSDHRNRLPTITVNGIETDTTLYAGPYSGGFQAAFGSKSHEDTLNLDSISSWEEYQELLADGSYFASSRDAYPELNQSVTVYEFSNEVADKEKWPAASLAISFQIAQADTQILTWGFNGVDKDEAASKQRYSYFVPGEGSSAYGMPRYLIVVGEDLREYKMQGYKNGGCHAGTEIDVTATTKRYETTLGAILRKGMEEYFTRYANNEENAIVQNILPIEDVLGLSTELLFDYGVLADKRVMRYDTGMLEDIFSEALHQDRVFYQEFAVTIPANGSVEIKADMFKDPSYDFTCSGRDNVGVNGYDLMTTLGSSLNFTAQTATIEHTQGIEIVRQNYGFDLLNGITSVTLDLKQEHYYLEVKIVRQAE